MEKTIAWEKAKICSARPEFQHPGRYLSHKERRRRLPYFGSAKRAMYYVFRHNEIIQKAASKVGVSHSIIQAIVFREIMLFSIKDIFQFHNPNTGRGICRISYQQAKRADEHFGMERSYEETCKLLKTVEGNIGYAAKLVKRKADKYGFDAKKLTDGQIIEVMTSITKDSLYGRGIQVFTRAFQKTGT